jgi:hypothetical protein
MSQAVLREVIPKHDRKCKQGGNHSAFPPVVLAALIAVVAIGTKCKYHEPRWRGGRQSMCASCGKSAVDDVKLKKCAACVDACEV